MPENNVTHSDPAGTKAIATKDTKNGAMMLRPGLGHKETIKGSKVDNGGS